MKLLIDSSYLNEHIFIKAIEYFLKNIEQVKLNSPSLAIASFICQIRRINFDWYENVINFDRVKLYIEKYLSGNWDFKSITFLDKIFHPDIDYIYSIYNSGIEHVSEDVLEKFMFDKKKNMDEKKI